MVLTSCSIHGLNYFLCVISSHTHVIGWFLYILLSTLLGNNDEYNTAGDENTGLSGTVSGNDGNLRDITFFLHTTDSPFDQEPSHILEGILQEAAATKDYMRACREAFDLIESHGLHQQREHVFKMVD